MLDWNTAKDKMWNGIGWYGFIGVITTSTTNLSLMFVEKHSYYVIHYNSGEMRPTAHNARSMKSVHSIFRDTNCKFLCVLRRLFYNNGSSLILKEMEKSASVLRQHNIVFLA